MTRARISSSSIRITWTDCRAQSKAASLKGIPLSWNSMPSHSKAQYSSCWSYRAVMSPHETSGGGPVFDFRKGHIISHVERWNSATPVRGLKPTQANPRLPAKPEALPGVGSSDLDSDPRARMGVEGTVIEQFFVAQPGPDLRIAIQAQPVRK